MKTAISLLTIVYAAILVYDFPKLKQQRRSDIAVYAGIMLISLYMSIKYVFHLQWPFVMDVMDYLYSGVGARIVKYLKAPS
jgi:multisubunit Na+/H+ antiporter MnhB subunit